MPGCVATIRHNLSVCESFEEAFRQAFQAPSARDHNEGLICEIGTFCVNGDDCVVHRTVAHHHYWVRMPILKSRQGVTRGTPDVENMNLWGVFLSNSQCRP